MKIKDYHFQPFDKDDVDGVAKLQEFHWGPNIAGNVQHLKWKYYDTPYSQEPIAYTVKKNRSVVGFMGLIPTRWRSGDDMIDLLSFGDAVIHPDHRGKGLYPSLIDGLIGEVRNSSYQGFLNLSNNAVTSHVMEKMGFLSLKKRSYFKRVDYLNILKNYVSRKEYRDYSSGNVKFSLSPDIDGMVRYDARMKRNDKIHLFKDRSFYNWRFGSRKKKYHFLYNHDDGRMVAYMIIFLNKQGSARIIDFAYDDLRYLMEIIGKIIKENNYPMINLMDVNIDNDLQSGLGKYRFLKKHLYSSFIGEKGESYISYKPIEGSSRPDEKVFDRSILEDINNWNIKEIASDGV